MEKVKNVDIKDYDSPVKPTWCPGCGNFMILKAIKAALSGLNIPPYKTVIISGIGCGSRTPYFIRANGFHTIHGRPIPIATGVKLVRDDLNVMVVAGDGDTYGIGTEHFIHLFRMNVGITLIVQNNGVFGLTRGQPSPTSSKYYEDINRKSFDPILYALVGGATFIARVWTGDVAKMEYVIKEAIKHSYIEGRGTSFIDIIQLCITYNPKVEDEFFTNYYRKRVFYVDEQENYNEDNYIKAFTYMINQGENRVPMGIIYRNRNAVSLERIINRNKKPIAMQKITDINIKELLDNLS